MCDDLDGNGIITIAEMQFFYEEQYNRMECMAQEPIIFEDILCQIVDMVSPEVLFFSLHAYFRSSSLNLSNKKFYAQNETYFTLRDIKACKLSGNVFNILFNLNKFMAFESRDPYLIRQVSFVYLL